MTPPRELRVRDRVRCNTPSASGGDYVVAEFVTLRGYVLRGGVQHAMDAPGAVLQAVGKPTRRTKVGLDRIHLHGKARKSGWSLVMEGSVTFIEETEGGPGVRLRKAEG